MGVARSVPSLADGSTFASVLAERVCSLGRAVALLMARPIPTDRASDSDAATPGAIPHNYENHGHLVRQA